MYDDLIHKAMWAVDHAAFVEILKRAEMGLLAASSRLPRGSGNVAVIPLHGMLTQRGSGLDAFFGGTSVDGFSAAFSRAVNDDSVKGIVLDVDSPGGTTAGIETAANRIYDARGIKPIVAVANSQMASAAYWLGSAANELVAAPGADVGSIGVFRMHTDHSEMLASEGIKVSFIAAGKYKTEANPYEPLDSDAREFHQTQVDSTYRDFIASVARHRGTTRADVRANYGEGRSLDAKDAQKAGLVDRVASIDRVVSGLMRGRTPASTTERITANLMVGWTTGIVQVLARHHRERLDAMSI